MSNPLPRRPEGQPGWLLSVARDERLAFMVVGAANTGIGVFWFAFFHLTVGRLIGYLTVLTLSHVASVLCAFVLYRKAVFRVHGHVWRDLARFESVYLGGLAINFILLPIPVELLGWTVLVSQLVIVGLTACLSYVGHKYFSFRRSAPELAAGDERPSQSDADSRPT
jgi:putative flippase GtrA